MKKILSLLVLILMTTAMAVAKDIKTVTLTTNPQMHCENCEAKIKKGLRYERGIKDIQTSVPNQTVTVKYDADKISLDAIVKALAKIGYTATEKSACKDGETSSCTEGCCK